MNIQQLREAGVQYVRILWTDHANLIRAKAAHLSLLDAGLPDGVGIAAAQLALPVMADVVVPGAGLGPVGEVRLVPDWDTLTVLPYAPAQAQVLGDLRLGAGPWDCCPRAFLREQIRAAAQFGLTVNAAFENEFFLLRRDNGSYTPADTTVFAHTSGFNRHARFMLDLSAALEAQGLQPEFYYPEAGPGQQELSVRYSDALQAADQQITFRETARGVAEAHGLVASFLPKPFEGVAGSGCHLNLSLWRDGANAMADPHHPTGISREGQHFLAGVLFHLPALCALSVPSHNSYHRLRPHFWAGAYTAWGYENREAALRVSRAGHACSRFELKTSDASANPYLALGALIAAGLDGIEQQRPLPAEAVGDPALMSEEARRASGIELLPQSLHEAVTALERNTVLLDALGEARSRAYLAVRRAEWTALKDLNLPEELQLLAERY
ncbi:glutamine synthetase family protein [Deinococcus deserti]|uniref:Putative glutamate--ammonia ligase (Glutamine synthetase) n=1 Tax=Deinococcus deserti (strain DSM 17065 / CIP 109153 / LMG 22923 / VCD115) TaxID=546414 RepID=C1D3D1_DEIDV|nr:glutamine synthetase family protein [Deinococcus deserti]ACO48010.1 putative glutamate--ammonia ligase (glutamine synthetase) [Deinococcus deserti VCD115]